MTTNLSRSIGFILATIISIALGVFVAAWWLIIAIACLAVAAYFWTRDRSYHTIDRHLITTRRPAHTRSDFRLNRRMR